MTRKDASIRQLLEHLPLKDRSWEVIHDWDEDSFAVGIAHVADPERWVYVSTWNLPPGIYYYDCDVATGPDAGDCITASHGESVDFATLLRAITEHLSGRAR